MVIDMNESKLDSVEHIREFLAGTTEVAFSISAQESSRHRFIEQVLKRLHYFALSKSARGVVFAYMRRLSEYSHAQLCRLIAQYRDTESLSPRRRTSRTSFTRTYTREDAALLAEVDRLHDTLSGPATKVLLVRAAERFGDQRFTRLARISVSHLYNLRQSEPYSPSNASCTIPPAPPVWPSERVARPPLRACQATSASIRCTRAIRTG